MTTLAFTVRPSSVLPDHRPLYKITQLLLVLLLASRGKKSSRVRLQLFNWVLKDTDRRNKLVQASQSQEIDFPAWGLDPTLDTALSLAQAGGLVETTAKTVALSEMGKTFCESVLRENLYNDDVDYLRSLGITITEKMVDTIVDRWV
jgi:hypothetical protein